MSRAMEELRGYFAVHSQGLGHATRAVAGRRGASRTRIPTPLILDATRHDFARDPLSRLIEGPANFWASRIVRRADLILAAEPAPGWPNVRRIGPIVRGFSAPREQLREDFVFRKKTILVTVGGTAVGEFLIREAVQAFHDLKLDDVSMVVVSGPKLKADAAPGVYTYGFLPNLQDYLLAADLVITTAGKGTVNEALAAGTPVIAIPPKGHAEAERNAAVLGYRFEDIHRLRELIPQKLALGRLPPKPMGNDQAVEFLMDFLERAENR